MATQMLRNDLEIRMHDCLDTFVIFIGAFALGSIVTTVILLVVELKNTGV